MPALGVDRAAAQSASDVLVRVDPVRRVPLAQSVPVIGRLVAQRLGVVAARIAGPVDAFQVQVGDRLEAGQTIAVLDTASLKARRDSAAGHLQAAKAELTTKKAELALAEQEFKRMEGLRKSAAFSQARYDDAHQRVTIVEAEVGQAAAAVASARADLDLADINLREAVIKAPYPGVVTDRLTEVGAYVQSGDAIVRMVGDQSLEIEADVPFQNLAGIEPGTEIRIALDDGTQHSAVVRAILPAENPLTRTRTVRLIPNIGETRRTLAHDQSVTLHVPVGPEREVLSVHKDAVIKRRGQDMVFIVEDGQAQPRPVDLGGAVGNRFEVRGGLRDGDQAVVRGNERLKPGDKVRVAGEAS